MKNYSPSILKQTSIELLSAKMQIRHVMKKNNRKKDPTLVLNIFSYKLQTTERFYKSWLKKKKKKCNRMFFHVLISSLSLTVCKSLLKIFRVNEKAPTFHFETLVLKNSHSVQYIYYIYYIIYSRLYVFSRACFSCHLLYQLQNIRNMKNEMSFALTGDIWLFHATLDNLRSAFI